MFRLKNLLLCTIPDVPQLDFDSEEVGVGEKQCVSGKQNVSSGETMSLRERQCVFGRDTVASGDRMSGS